MKTSENRGTIRTRVTASGEIAATMPDGDVYYMGWWRAILFLVAAKRRGFRVEADD